jgi:hypothetical protein
MVKVDYLIPEVKVVKGKIIESDKYTIPKTKYFCGYCDIISDDNNNFNERNYIIPSLISLQPTEKQKNTIYLINSKMRLGLRALTKKQCGRDIEKYLAIAVDNKKSMFDDSIRIK